MTVRGERRIDLTGPWRGLNAAGVEFALGRVVDEAEAMQAAHAFVHGFGYATAEFWLLGHGHWLSRLCDVTGFHPVLSVLRCDACLGPDRLTRDCIAGVGMTTQSKTSRDAKNYSDVGSTAGEKTHVPPYKQPSTAVSRCRWNCIVNVKIEHAFRSTNPSAKLIPAVNRVAARLASRTQISASLFPIPYSLFPSRHRTTLSAFFAVARPFNVSSPFAPEKFAS